MAEEFDNPIEYHPADARFVANDELVKARAERGWTQEETASLIRLQLSERNPDLKGREWYQKIESAQRSVSTDYAVAIARVFKLPVDKLFTKRESNYGPAFTRG